ncbi:Tetracycline repressor protein class B from transposon Tn10 [Listeria grayi]|uniref:Tetracycline repressor protein class B from transposon Tn10 n=1 Tax=Listeria grayi TaxID=1641 RepID=A0A378MG63_LISGR|nr:TetR/AcrR family transcriptional regulator [Listeria grayi]MBC1922734.1 TetR/AcrR family transcriptional regulator [Listeria grayi]STY45357.1 Tetracycline repressor protein class B from transposon Tn10 [Listeria grayi]VEI32155.1 Tetracycline repressor protein class B from transposon Tn10 [Listeria grayi]
MAQKRNLTKAKIIDVTFELANEIGITHINFPKISERLNIKYPSLYNHFANIDVLKIAMTETFVANLNQQLIKSLLGKAGKDAIHTFAMTYRDIAFENRAGYELFINCPSFDNEQLTNQFLEMTYMIRQILVPYSLSEEETVHKSREFRSILHGYISLVFLGYFRHQLDHEESFERMIADYIQSLE